MKTYIRHSRAANRLIASRRASSRSERRALALVARRRRAAAAGCGNTDAIRRGGTTGGTTLTVYSSLPTPGRGVSRDIVDGEKLALAAGRTGKIGKYSVNFSSLDEARRRRRAAPGGRGRAARDGDGRHADRGADRHASTPRRARSAIPLLNATGVLHVSLGAGYAGFTEPRRPDEPARWYPAARRTFARLVGDDRAQARALVRRGGRRGGSSVEAEGERRRGGAGGRGAARRRARPAAAVGDTPGRDGAVIYAGADPVDAAGVAESVARESPGARVVLPDEVVRAGVDALIRGARRARTVLVSRAPRAGLDARAARLRGRLRAHLRAQARALRRARPRGDDERARRARRAAARRRAPAPASA